jgi:hypothetical protein
MPLITLEGHFLRHLRFFVCLIYKDIQKGSGEKIIYEEGLPNM